MEPFGNGFLQGDKTCIVPVLQPTPSLPLTITTSSLAISFDTRTRIEAAVNAKAPVCV